jgi:hypothetical protein
MVIRIINVKGVGGNEAENHPPVCTYRYREKTLELAFERMQPETRHIHIGDDAGRVEPRENIAEFDDVFGENAARVVICMKASQPLVAYRPDHF